MVILKTFPRLNLTIDLYKISNNPTGKFQTLLDAMAGIRPLCRRLK